MDKSTLVVEHLKSTVANKLNVAAKQIKHNLSNLNEFQYGVVTVLVGLVLVQLVYSLSMTYSSLFSLSVDLVKVVFTLLSVFSLFAWWHMLYGKTWSDASIFILFLSCFMSEFLVQLAGNNDKSNIQSTYKKATNKTVSNTNNNDNNHQQQQHKNSSYSNVIYLSSDLAQYVFILVVCTLTNSLLNSKLIKNFLFVFSLCVARFCGSIYLFDIIPLSVNAYFTYLCAFSGVLFSHYLHKFLNEFNSTYYNSNNKYNNNNNNNVINHNTANTITNNNNNHKNKPRIEINNLDDDSFKMTPINNHKYYTSLKASNNSSCNKVRRKNSSFESFKRRTSLPTIPLKFEKLNSGNGYLDEVIYLIDEILNQKQDLSLESVFQSLESIKQLVHSIKLKSLSSFYNELRTPLHVTPASLHFAKSTKSKHSLTLSSSTTNNNELKQQNCFDLNQFHSNSCSADEDEDDNRNMLSVFYNSNQLQQQQQQQHKNRNRRSLPARSPSLAWSSTTTAANGMPIVENVTSKQRSSSLKLAGFISQNLFLTAHASSKELLERQIDSKDASHATLNLQSKSDQLMNALISKASNNSDEDGDGDDEEEENTAASSLISNVSNLNNKTSDYESGESPNSSDYNSDNDKLQLKDLQYQYSALSVSNKKLDEIQEENSSIKLPWHESETNQIELLDYLHDWNFPIFQLNEKTDNHILSKMALKIFDRIGLFKSFDISIDAFILYFSELEKGYIDLPYHNKMHAADVLHACYYLTTQPVPGFSHVENNTGKDRQSLKHFHNLNKYKLNNESYGSVGANFDPLELLALYCSAAMHDYDHPGRNNQFLVRINSPLALLYNDRSVLENHHAAASWKLFQSNSKFNFLSGLDAAELKRFRFLVIENILATDLNKHFLIINDFKNIVKNKNISSNQCSPDIDWTNESDRLTISKMIIKLADINSPLKEKDLHLQWTERICEEFYQQGEEEERLGIPISSFMDRQNPQVAKLQENFMRGLVGTLSDAYVSAGLMPGILIEDSHLTATDLDELSDSDLDSSQVKTREANKSAKIFYSELTSNFKTNYEMWCEQLKQQEQPKQQLLD